MEPEVDYLAGIVSGLVSNPDAVRIERTTDDMGVLLSLHVAPDDMGKVIGKEGATAKAIRTLLRVMGMRNQARINMKIIEPEGRPSRAVPAELQDIDTALEALGN